MRRNGEVAERANNNGVVKRTSRRCHGESASVVSLIQYDVTSRVIAGHRITGQLWLEMGRTYFLESRSGLKIFYFL